MCRTRNNVNKRINIYKRDRELYRPRIMYEKNRVKSRRQLVFAAESVWWRLRLRFQYPFVHFKTNRKLLKLLKKIFLRMFQKLLMFTYTGYITSINIYMCLPILYLHYFVLVANLGIYFNTFDDSFFFLVLGVQYSLIPSP